MASPRHQTLSRIEFDGGSYSFSLDRITRLDEDSRIEYAFVWRGDKRGPDYIMQKPAFFNWQWAGQLIRQAIADNQLEIGDIEPFIRSMMGLSKKDPDEKARNRA